MKRAALAAQRRIDLDTKGFEESAYTYGDGSDFKMKMDKAVEVLICYVTAWVLAIISRAKFKTRFSLVLLIIYGSLLALSFFGFILLICIMLGLF